MTIHQFTSQVQALILESRFQMNLIGICRRLQDRLGSASSHKLVVRRSILKTIESLVFGVAAQLRHGLPLDVTAVLAIKNTRRHNHVSNIIL